MSKRNTAELIKKTPADLTKHELTLVKEISELKVNTATMTTSNVRALRYKKRELARVKTLISSKAKETK